MVLPKPLHSLPQPCWRVLDGVVERAPIPWLMGIVNATPDSFSDGGSFLASGAAIDHALQLVKDGADIIDVGGESTRPGADPVPAQAERVRIVPVIAGIA